ncbi:hypothetical protein QYE76_035509 [Lolium multiflorum]|uniref:Uncharacterized protein n=1 Tax=Lolium multiflorum TaxID=4521 RepID=A0AAD8QZU0_LOLMU|nr:hypothetical protein QYE76_035509 [Lolium multiflorum]
MKRMRGKVVDNEKRKRAAEDMGDAMRALKNRANHSKQDMDILAALEEMRSMKSRHAGVSVNRMLEILKHSTHLKEEKIVAELDDEDEELIKSITSQNSKNHVKRIEDDDGDEHFVIPGQLRFMAEETRPWDLRCPKFIVKPKPFGANPQRKKMTESGKASTCLRGKKWRFRRENECSSVPLPD